MDGYRTGRAALNAAVFGHHRDGYSRCDRRRSDDLHIPLWAESVAYLLEGIVQGSTWHLLEFIDRKALPGSLKKLRTYAKGSLGIGRFPAHDLLRDQLDAFFAGRSANFDIPLTLHGSEFTQLVWRRLLKIGAGQIETYGALAKDLGRPSATRAVARANGANQIALIVPCHRVIGADGNLTGYGGGLWRKQRLIELERDYLKETAA